MQIMFQLLNEPTISGISGNETKNCSGCDTESK